MKKLKFFSLALLFSVSFILASAQQTSKETERIQNSAKVLTDFSKMEDSIPAELFRQAEGIIVIPKMINAGLALGGKRGKGVAMVKTNGTWSNPVFVTFTGGSFGLQIGVQSVDLVLVFKHKSTLVNMKNGDFTIGGDISVAAGPIGRSSTAGTDYKLDAEVYSYSRSKGLFAGLSVNGSNISIDKSANAKFYGDASSSQSIFASTKSTSAAVANLRTTISAM